jgi:hypothetical protein
MIKIFENKYQKSHLKKEFETKISKKQRETNCLEINSKQSKKLNIEGQIPKKRELVLYYRKSINNIERQMDDFDFMVICFILDKYIQNENSKVFTNIVIVSRVSEQYPKFIEKRFKNIEYRDVSGNDFRTQSSIFANTILFNTGSINEQIDKYSIPIIPFTNKFHQSWSSNFENKSVILNLLYYCDDEKNFIPNFDKNLEFFKKFDRGNSISNVMGEIIRAVKELENKMLEN